MHICTNIICIKFNVSSSKLPSGDFKTPLHQIQQYNVLLLFVIETSEANRRDKYDHNWQEW